MLRIVVAPDKFKGVLDAAAAAEAIADGVRRARPDAQIHIAAMADGGEGTLDCLLAAHHGRRQQVHAHGPLGDEIAVPVALVHEASTAIVELANVSGYALVPPERRDPLITTTFGLGEVLRAVIDANIESVTLAVGGSATCDGGAGMMQALGLGLLDKAGRLLPPGIGGGRLLDIHRLIWQSPPDNLELVQFTIACDVLNPACGPSGAARVFAPQKGANAAAVERLDRGLSHWADLLQSAGGHDVREMPGTGAAGGVAMPLLALTNANAVPGVDLVMEANGLASHIAPADLVLTGEGRLDAQSLMGKVVGAVGRLARSLDVPCVALVGTTGPGADQTLSVLDRFVALDAPLHECASRLTEAARRITSEMC